MPREIKFRAWAKDFDTGKYQMFYDVQCAYDTISREGNVLPHDQWDNFASLLNDQDVKVMQFTGLLSKSGKEIYEGDINGNGWVVTWSDKCACFHFLWSKSPDQLFAILPETEIIGNKYENPELLNEKTQTP